MAEKTKWSSEQKPFSVFWLLMGAWILIIALLMGIILADQHFQITTSLKQVPLEDTIIIEGGAAVLHISHPQELFIDTGNLKGVPFGFWITCATTNNSCLPASSPAAYIIYIDVPKNDLGFTNLSGEPVPAQIALTPSLNPTPAVLYGTLSFVAMTENAPVKISLSTLQLPNTTPTLLSTIIIPKEKQLDAQLRHVSSLLSTSAVWGTMLTLVGGLVLAAWNKTLGDQKDKKEKDEKEKDRQKVEDEKEKERQKTEDEQTQIFLELIQKSPEESARLFIDYSRRKYSLSISLFEKIQSVWKENAPKELIMLSNLEQERLHNRLADYVAKLDDSEKQKINPALRFALAKMVDDAWKISANHIVRKLIDVKFPVDSDLLVVLEKRYRSSVVKVWPQMTYWQPIETPDLAANEDVKYKNLRRTISPFGTPKAEHDGFIVQSHYVKFKDSTVKENYLYDEITRDYPIIILGKGAWGKTASAIWLLEQAINRKITALKGTNNPPIFPVYCPIDIKGNLNDIATSFSLAILNYLAFEPTGFFQRSEVGKSSIAHLLSTYVASSGNLTLRFREAGLPKTGIGAELNEEITSLMQGIDLLAPIKEVDLLKLLSESFPFGFEKTWFILDFQGELESNKPDTVKNCLDLLQKIGQAGIITKSFMSYKKDYIRDFVNTPVPVRELKWQYDDLKGLIELRTGLTGMGSSISEWCEPDARYPRSPFAPEKRLINASGGTPRGVIQKANQLLKRIGEKQSSLSVDDLDEILGRV